MHRAREIWQIFILLFWTIHCLLWTVSTFKAFNPSLMTSWPNFLWDIFAIQANSFAHSSILHLHPHTLYMFTMVSPIYWYLWGFFVGWLTVHSFVVFHAQHMGKCAVQIQSLTLISLQIMLSFYIVSSAGHVIYHYMLRFLDFRSEHGQNISCIPDKKCVYSTSCSMNFLLSCCLYYICICVAFIKCFEPALIVEKGTKEFNTVVIMTITIFQQYSSFWLSVVLVG